MTSIAIIGSGMAAFGAAHRLRSEAVDFQLFDRNAFFGGHTVTRRYEPGFLFDVGPHVSFTKDERIQKIFAASIDDDYETHDYKFNNYWQGYWVKHPAQTNLHGLPVDVIVQIIADFVVQSGITPDIRNYHDWLVASYGKTFAEWFPERYTFKYHTTQAANLTTDWMGPRMYRPRLEEVLQGALSPTAPNVHYIQNFRYPSKNGFGSYLSKWASEFNPQLNHEVTKIDPKARVLDFANGHRVNYDALISSVPLPELLKLIEGVPGDVRAASNYLACSACVLVNLGLARNDFANTHISYFYDLDVVFPRVSYPHLMSAGNTPKGCGSIQVEIYFSEKYRPFTGVPADYIEPAIRDLVRCGVLREDEKFLLKDAVYIPYANIIFDHDRKAALEAVHGYLDDIQVRYCGRYGSWGYYWTDDSFISGERAAERVLSSDCRSTA